jgi:hypothetical protein
MASCGLEMISLVSVWSQFTVRMKFLALSIDITGGSFSIFVTCHIVIAAAS